MLETLYDKVLTKNLKAHLLQQRQMLHYTPQPFELNREVTTSSEYEYNPSNTGSNSNSGSNSGPNNSGNSGSSGSSGYTY